MAETINAGYSTKFTRDYFDSLLLEMRYFDAVLPSTKLELYGETFSTPIMLAALSHLGERAHPGGMAEAARGIKAADAVMWAGTGTEAELEAIVATGARTVKIIKPHADNRDILKKIEHAEKCGCLAVGMDIDHAFNRKGKYDVVDNEEMRPKSLEEIVAEVYADPNPFPPFSPEFLLLILAPLGAALFIIRLLTHFLRRSGRRRKDRAPKPENRYFR